MKSAMKYEPSQRIIHLTETFFNTLEPEEKEQQVEKIRPYMDRLALGLFRIVVMGEVKKGKSRFINALLGKPDLLPVDTDVTTSTVYKIMYGSKYVYTVFFLPEANASVKESKVIPKHHLWQYGTEKGNPRNIKKVDFIGIEIPHPLLKKGIAFIDTPGVGGLFKKHRDITFDYAPNADAVFFILDSVETLISEDEINFLKELITITPNVLFIQTKTDIAGEDQWLAWRNRNLEIISDHLKLPKEKIPYFTISSKLKELGDEEKRKASNETVETCFEDLRDSGFVPVINFINRQLVSAKNLLLARQTIQRILPDVSKAGQLLQYRLGIAEEQNRGKLEEIEKSLLETERQIKDWEEGAVRTNTRRFNDDISDLKRNFLNIIEDEFDCRSQQFKDLVNHCRSTLTTQDKIAKEGQTYLNDYSASCTSRGRKLIEEYRIQFFDCFNETIKKNMAELDDMLSFKITVTGANINIKECVIDKEAIKSALLWGSFAATLAGGAISFGFVKVAPLLFGVMLNPLGLPAAGIIAAAAIFAGSHTFHAVLEQKYEVAFAKLERALKETSQIAIKSVNKAFQEMATLLERHARYEFEDMVIETRWSLKKRLDEVQQAKRRTKKEANEVILSLKPRLVQVKEIDQTLKKINSEIISKK